MTEKRASEIMEKTVINGSPHPNTLEYMDALAKKPLAINTGSLVGAGACATAAMGYLTRPMTEEEVYELSDAIMKGDRQGTAKEIGDLLFACVRNYHEEFEKKLAQEIGPDNNVMDVLISFMKLHIENSGTTNPLFYSEVQKYPKVKKYIANRNQENRSKSIAFLTRGVNEGYFRSDVNYEIINLMTEVFMKHVMDTELYRTYPLTTIFKDFFVTILRGVCTQQGIALIDNFKI